MLRNGKFKWFSVSMVCGLAVGLVLCAIMPAALAAEPATQAGGGKSSGAAPKSSDWCQYQGANQNNYSSDKFQSTWGADGPKKLWHKAIGVGFSSVTAWKGQVFTMGNADDKDTLWCLDARTGKEIWKYSYPCKSAKDFPGPRCTPAIDGQSVFSLSRDGQLLRVDLATGKPKWTKNVVADLGVKLPMWQLGNSPALMGDLILLDFGRTIALKKSDGELAWSGPQHVQSYSTPRVFCLPDKAAVASFPGDCLLVLDAADGKEISRYPWKTKYDITAIMPVVSGDKIFVSTGYGTGAAVVDAATGKEVWKNKELAIHANNPVLYDGFLYAVTGDFNSVGQLKCVEFATGKAKWSQDGVPVGSLTMADGKLIVLDGKGTLIVASASPDGYKELARAKVLQGRCWTTPVMIDGRIYVRNNEPGELLCLDVKPEAK